MISKEQLSELEKLSGHFEARKQRAAERLNSVKGNKWYFAIIGLEGELDEFALPPLAKIQRVTEPPGEVELASALKNSELFSAIGRYSKLIKYELSIDREALNSDQAAMNFAWWTISMLRIKALAEILIPAMSDYSWSTISAITDGKCYAQLLEDVPTVRITNQVVLTQSDADWITNNIIGLGKLGEYPKFRLAVDSLTTHHFSNSERMMAATLWSGIEALFEIQSELRFRLAVLIASILEPRGNSRKEAYRMIKKLYDVRSKAVHGSPLTNARISEHIVEVRKLLSRLLCLFIESGKLMSENYIDELVFC